MITEPIEQGTVLFYDFKDSMKPEFAGSHPVMVVTPKENQRDLTVMIVPLTSKLSNARNKFAVEITNKAFVATSRTGQSFAICDKMRNVALERLDHYTLGRREGANHRPNYQITGEDLQNIQMACSRAFYTERDFKRFFSKGPLAQRFLQLLKRQKSSVDASKLAAKIPAKPKRSRTGIFGRKTKGGAEAPVMAAVTKQLADA